MARSTNRLEALLHLLPASVSEQLEQECSEYPGYAPSLDAILEKAEAAGVEGVQRKLLDDSSSLYRLQGAFIEIELATLLSPHVDGVELIVPDQATGSTTPTSPDLSLHFQGQRAVVDVRRMTQHLTLAEASHRLNPIVSDGPSGFEYVIVAPTWAGLPATTYNARADRDAEIEQVALALAESLPRATASDSELPGGWAWRRSPSVNDDVSKVVCIEMRAPGRPDEQMLREQMRHRIRALAKKRSKFSSSHRDDAYIVALWFEMPFSPIPFAGEVWFGTQPPYRLGDPQTGYKLTEDGLLQNPPVSDLAGALWAERSRVAYLPNPLSDNGAVADRLAGRLPHPDELR